MQSTNQPRSNESGFTLIELLIAMSLLLFGIMSFVMFSGNLVNKNSQNMKRTVAASLAAEKIEDLKNTATSTTLTNTTASDTLDIDGNAGGPAVFTRTWTISGTSDNTNIQVAVSWDRMGTNDVGYGAGKAGVTLQTAINQ